MIYPQQQIIKLFDDQDVCEITVSDEQYDEAIDQSLDDSDVNFYIIEYKYSNLQEGDADFNRDYDPIQDSISGLTACFDEKFLKREFNQRNKRSKISMAAGC